MPRINTYSDNASIENDDKLLTYDTQGAATKLTAFSTIWNWIVSKLHALTSSSAALTPSTDRVLMDKNGTMTRVEPSTVAKYGIETYNGSTIAGSAQTVKAALDALNSKAAVGVNTYSPQILSGSENFATRNHQFAYVQVGGLLFISGRFEIVSVGSTPTNNTLSFTLPSGFTCNEFVGNIGSFALNRTGTDIVKLSLRQGTNNVYIQEGAGGNNVLPTLGNGYVMFYCIVMLS